MKRMDKSAGFLVVLLILTTLFSSALAAGQLQYGPKDKTVAVGDKVVFRAGATGFTGITWHMVSPDGEKDLLAKEIPGYFPGSSISGKNSIAFTIKNVTAEMNGWQVYCVFSGNGKAVTNKATLWIEGYSEGVLQELQSHDADTEQPSGTTDTDGDGLLTLVESTPEPTAEPDPDTRLIITAVNCTLSADGYADGTSIDFTKAGSIKVKVTGKNVGCWVINGIRYDFNNVPKTITFNGLKKSLTIEACKKGGKSSTLLSEEAILEARTGDTLKVTTKSAIMCHLTSKKAQKGGWFSSFDFTEDYTNKATKKTESGGRVTVHVRAKPGYGEGVSYWIFNGVHVSFNAYVTEFTVTNLNESMKYEAAMYNEKLYTVSCTNCTFTDAQHSGASSGQVPGGTIIKITPNEGGSGLWSGSRSSKTVVTAATISHTVRGNCSFTWTSYKGAVYHPLTASLPPVPDAQ